MTDAEENPRSRKAFMRSAFAMPTGGLSSRGDRGTDLVDTSLQDQPRGSSLTKLSLSEASQLVRSKRVSPVELTQECLSQIERLNPKLNAFISVTADSALAQARKAEDEIQRGHWSGPLHGIPIALKDLVDIAGTPTTGASALFTNRVPTQDAEIVRRLRIGGAVLLGKLNMHELAYGGSSLISYFGPVRNPWAPDFIAGGSSSGSAVAVAAQLCYAAIGTDTGGSIRLPAAHCGIVGLKPTYGRVSLRGVMPLAWSLDHVGPMTRTVTDAALTLQVIAGYDPEDASSTNTPVADYPATLSDKTSSLRIGIPRAFFYQGLHPEIQAAIDISLSVLRKVTASQHEIEIPAAIDTAILILKAEAYACYREDVAKNPELFQAETLKRLLAGAEIIAADYICARRQLDQFRRSIPKVFDTVDLLVTPTTPVPPFTISELLADLDNVRAKEVLTARNARSFNVFGLPTITIPCGFTSKSLPIGLQIAGPPGGEATLLRLAYSYERETNWHDQQPKIVG
jgi:aspartyl-tRNA(Asn)/glutamyl-tRNA(Gln) amidotransferase subunit A